MIEGIMLIAGFRLGGNISLDAGWLLCSNIDFGGGEYKQVSTTQSGVLPAGRGGASGSICDALQGP
jgi:hypothetical protein